MIYSGEYRVPSNFLYHAHASALGGFIARPVSQPINAPAVSVLTPSGGYQSTVHENYRLESIVSYRRAVTQVSGSQGNGAYNSFASVEIDDLNIENEVTADRIVAKISNTVRLDGDEPEFSVGGCQFINLRIAGVLVSPVLSIDLHTKLNTHTKLEAAWLNDKDLDHNSLRSAVRQWYLLQSDIDTEEKDAKSHAIQKPRKSRNERIYTSLLAGFSGSIAHLTRNGMQLIVPNFGKIYLAEMFVSKYSRSLTMIRMELGSPVDGDGSAGHLDLNGMGWP